jgi:glycosyltransferase involved in cell wall biosynthesis
MVIPHGDLNYIFNHVIEKDGIFYENPTITFLVSINPYKGLKFFIEVMSLILAKFVINLIFLGIPRESMDKYYKYADQLGISKNILWGIKYILLDDMNNGIKNTNIFVFPYERTSQSDGIPAAFTLGKPVVIRSVVGLPEMIGNNIDGMIANSPPEMADKIIDLVKNNKKYIRMQKYIYSQRKNRNDWKNLYPNFLKLYNL